ncbi:DivIVA protein [Pilibacter termitis]|uniref:DivIVA protein n=1 Tax=Pilibacter termitis TaxID=263852 RepID=A0A1T4LS72_9ENTE|nr:DivIVA domain-containing protein [Pilibacter termitis]SJZ57466.1 DivIVA protein [Pilibacter termitis]
MVAKDNSLDSLKEMLSSTYESEIKNLESEIDELDKTIEKQEQQIENLTQFEKKNQTLEAEIKKLNDLLVAKEQEIQEQPNVSDVLAPYQEKILALEQKLEQSNQELAKVTEQATQAAQQAQSNENNSVAYQKLTDENTRLKQEQTKSAELVNELKKQLAHSQEEHTDMVSRNEYLRLKSDFVDLNEKYQEAQGKNESNFREDFSEVLVGYETQLMELQNKLDETNKTSAELQAENNRLKREMEEAKDNLHSMSAEDIADVLISAKIQAKKIVNRAEQEADHIVADARERLSFLKGEGDSYYTQLEELARQNEDFIKRLREKAEGIKR